MMSDKENNRDKAQEPQLGYQISDEIIERKFREAQNSTIPKMSEDEYHLRVKAALEKRIELMDSGKAIFYTIDEVDVMLEDSLKSYEN